MMDLIHQEGSTKANERANKALELTASSVVERGQFSCVSCCQRSCNRRWRQLTSGVGRRFFFLQKMLTKLIDAHA
ncbi:MAG: hypothetical protein M3R24_42090, partial [Chloroflexota bacterium]|nr:hypothetical protein [Chloroflexota bacterium]